MNTIAVPSRFACLRIDDDEDRKKVNNKKKTDKVVKKPTVSNKKTGASNTNNSKQTKKNKNKITEQQWEEWKEKDNKLVNDNFEQDLQDAILLSKLDYESKKTVITLDSKSNSNQNKKKKAKTMHLDEFLEGSEKKPVNGETDLESKPIQDVDDQFFEKMLEQTKKEVTKGKVEEERKEREHNIEEIISISQYQEKLKIEKERNAKLQQQFDRAKAEITALKERNKMLCNILGHGEMRDKAEILLELERLNVVKDELTEEVGHLHKLLEQERSKSALLDPQSSKHNKDKNKK